MFKSEIVTSAAGMVLIGLLGFTAHGVTTAQTEVKAVIVTPAKDIKKVERKKRTSRSLIRISPIERLNPKRVAGGKVRHHRHHRTYRVSRSYSRENIPTGINQRIGKGLAAQRGWTGEQWNCLQSLWYKESGWSINSGSPSSAFGIPQALPGTKMASAGSDWRTNASTQIRWGLGYISGRYVTPCAAWAHSQSHNWY